MAPNLQELFSWEALVACSHVSSLSVRSRMTAGLDGFRGSRPLSVGRDWNPAEAVRLLSIRRVDRLRHHVFFHSRKLAARRRSAAGLGRARTYPCIRRHALYIKLPKSLPAPNSCTRAMLPRVNTVVDPALGGDRHARPLHERHLFRRRGGHQIDQIAAGPQVERGDGDIEPFWAHQDSMPALVVQSVQASSMEAPRRRFT